jgi:hypothetical protein
VGNAHHSSQPTGSLPWQPAVGMHLCSGAGEGEAFGGRCPPYMTSMPSTPPVRGTCASPRRAVLRRRYWFHRGVSSSRQDPLLWRRLRSETGGEGLATEAARRLLRVLRFLRGESQRRPPRQAPFTCVILAIFAPWRETVRAASKDQPPALASAGQARPLTVWRALAAMTSRSCAAPVQEPGLLTSEKNRSDPFCLPCSGGVNGPDPRAGNSPARR